jgi:hypothetical protein
MRLFKLGILCAALFAGGCATDYSWQRRDGGPAGGRSFDYAISECRRISGRYDEEIMRRCMERYGFVWAPSPYESYCYNSDCRYSEYRPHRRHHHRHRYDD